MVPHGPAHRTARRPAPSRRRSRKELVSNTPPPFSLVISIRVSFFLSRASACAPQTYHRTSRAHAGDRFGPGERLFCVAALSLSSTLVYAHARFVQPLTHAQSLHAGAQCVRSLARRPIQRCRRPPAPTARSRRRSRTIPSAPPPRDYVPPEDATGEKKRAVWAKGRSISKRGKNGRGKRGTLERRAQAERDAAEALRALRGQNAGGKRTRARRERLRSELHSSVRKNAV